MSKKEILKNNKSVIGGLFLGLALVSLISYQVVESRLHDLKQVLEISIQAKYDKITEISKLIAKGEVNTTAGQVIADCTAEEREQFENRLVKLDAGLSTAELKELKSLFGRCAPVQSIQRSIMTIQLEEAISVLNTLVMQRKLLGTYAKHDTDLLQLETLLQHEQKINQLAITLVNLQNEIVEALLKGVAVNSEAANELRNKGLNINNELIATSQKAVEVRSLLDFS